MTDPKPLTPEVHPVPTTDEECAAFAAEHPCGCSCNGGPK